MNLRSLLPVLAASVGLLQAADSRLLEIRHVYVLPMSGGLDQYLANRLTQNGRYVVVTDPERADALLTDSIGSGFEDKYKQLYPPPPTPEQKAEAAKKKTSGDDDKGVIGMLNASTGTSRTSSFSKGKGNVFLVDRASRAVLWSTYLRPRNTSAPELNRVADQVVDRMDDAAERREKAGRKAEAKESKKVAAAPASAPVAAPAPAKPPAAAPPQAPPPAPAK